MRKISLLMVLAFVLGLSACGVTEVAAHTLSYLGGEVKTVSVNGEDWELVCVYTEYTNASGESALPADWVNVTAYQNGREIPVIVFTGQKIDGYIQCDTSVQDGVTAKVVWTFQPEDDSPVSVELSGGEKYTIGGEETSSTTEETETDALQMQKQQILKSALTRSDPSTVGALFALRHLHGGNAS